MKNDMRQDGPAGALELELAELVKRRFARGEAYDPARERATIAQAMRIAGPESEDAMRVLFETLFALTRARAPSARSAPDLVEEVAGARRVAFPSGTVVACCGAEGAYGQQAACRLVKAPAILYFRGFEDVCRAVETGTCAYGVLPMENSTAGSVAAVYDLMVDRNFKIVRATRLRIRHALLAPFGVRLLEVKEVVSHPQALAQCSRFLGAHRGIRQVPAGNTAVAARELAASGRRDAAVIASRDCADIYGLSVLKDGVSDTKNNFTRFILISRNLEVYSGANKMAFALALRHRSGALADILVRLAAAGANLTKLESRPVEGSDFEFRFVFELEAEPGDGRVLRQLSRIAVDPGVESFAFLGAYPERL